MLLRKKKVIPEMWYTYLTIDLASIAVPFIFSFHPKLRFYRHWGALLPALLIPGLFFICWDCFFTAKGVWGFNPKYVSGVYLFNLPLEEILFFLCIPYACLFSYHSIFTLWPKLHLPGRLTKLISWSLIAAGLCIAYIYSEKSYTFLTLLLMSLFIFGVTILYKNQWVDRFYICYGYMLLPFLIVNGLLTGSWIQEPVVWYNAAEIAGPRLLTIPLEDIAYGLLLIGVEVALYEYLLSGKRLSLAYRPFQEG
jgi:lycopene cyclase domain-containing protein